jgi:hypothetical protein
MLARLSSAIVPRKNSSSSSGAARLPHSVPRSRTYVQLEQWQTRIAKLQVASESMEETERLLSEALEDSTNEATNEKTNEAADEVQAPKTAADVRALFRELAKRIHPDFAHDAADERHRTQLMAQANAALLRNDADLLHRMLHGHDLPHDHDVAPAVELARTLKLLQQLQADLAAHPLRNGPAPRAHAARRR